MSNEYKQGIDRVAVDESFPYPIKLEYDNEYIYITPLWIPKHSNVLVSKNKNGSPIDLQEAFAVGGRIWIVVELATANGIWMNNKHRQNGIKIKHPCRTGKFRARLISNYSVIDPEVGEPIKFPINCRLTTERDVVRSTKYQDRMNVTLRAAYRYDASKEQNGVNLQRTGLVSNTIIINRKRIL